MDVICVKDVLNGSRTNLTFQHAEARGDAGGDARVRRVMKTFEEEVVNGGKSKLHIRGKGLLGRRGAPFRKNGLTLWMRRRLKGKLH